MNNLFTPIPEITTSITNLLIFVVAFISSTKLKQKDWKYFFLLLSLAALLGSIIHGINFSKQTIYYLWFILYFVFDILIHQLLFNTIDLISNKKLTKYKYHLILILYLSVIILEVNGIDFLQYFIYYTCLIIIIISTIIIKISKTNKQYLYFIYGLIIQILGGILLLAKSRFYILDHNGLYHLYMAYTTYLFYKAVK